MKPCPQCTRPAAFAAPSPYPARLAVMRLTAAEAEPLCARLNRARTTQQRGRFVLEPLDDRTLPFALYAEAGTSDIARILQGFAYAVHEDASGTRDW